jgi:hypothetical protein
MFRTFMEVSQGPTAIALDFVMFILAPEAAAQLVF